MAPLTLPLRRSLLRRFIQPRHIRRLATATDHPQSQQSFDNRVKLIEVGPRDGLQNEKKTIPLETKIELIQRLAKTGLPVIEAGSFVSPKWVPQMASSSEIMTHILSKGIPSEHPLTFSFLAPNTKGFDAAKGILDQHPDSFLPFPPTSQSPDSQTTSGSPKPTIEIAVFAAATESFSKANLNCSIAESLERFAPVISSAKAADLRVRAYISCVLGCPFEGTSVSPHVVADLSVSLLEAGADEISLGDTTGMGTAPKTRDLLECLKSAGLRNEDVAMHFHDTYGQALVNTLVSLEAGVRKFDSSVGGLGGCPYSPGATGNVSTEDVVYFLESLGMRTGVDLEALAEIGEWISEEVGRPNASSVGRAVLGARRRKRSEGKAA